MILKPVETFRTTASDELSFTFVYYLVLLAIYAILLSLSLSRFGMYWMMNGKILITMAMMLGQMVVSLLVSTLWIHLWVWLFGGREGLRNTFRAMAFSMTPVMLLGWLMPAGLIAGTVWGIVLEVLGIRELQKLTAKRAILAVAVPMIVGISGLIAFLALTDPHFLTSLGDVFAGSI
ncbi:MAG: YIP1 family protein [Methanoregula sp.]|nr:YIP1 family protein [Methanoregula sp.]